MHSLKNTVVAVCLLAVSFGLYHVSLNPEAVVDPADVPVLDISDGLQSMAEPPANGVESKLEVPSFPKLGNNDSAPGLPMAAQPKTTSSNPNAFSGERIPVESFKQDNAQKIQYPRTAAGNLSSIAKPELQTEIAQHELVDPSRDQGLIDALKQQQEATPTVNDRQFVAQPIASADSTFNNLATKLEPVESDSVGFDTAIETPATSNSEFDTLDFNSAFAQSEELIKATEFRAALKLLSRFYRDDNLTGPQRQRLLPTLDALAGKVIYSDEHHLTPQPYVVGANESLVDIADKWHVPAQLIYNVHQKALTNPMEDIQPGTQLKMIKGPFHAEIDLQVKVMTMYLGDLYAGRFPIRVGISGAPKPGSYQVVMKSKEGHAWRDSNGVDYPPGSPENGYGPNWIGLTGSLCIHEVANDAGDGHHGCIGLNAKDSRDVFAILAAKSELTIIR